MSLPKMTTAVNNISQLDTRPNAVNGLTADQLKAEFDKGPEAIKKFLNEVLIPALDSAITVDSLGAVPETRTVARKALSEDILLDASDIDYEATIDGTQVEDVETALGALKNAKSTVTFAVTKNANGTFTAGKTFAQLKAAYDAGKGLLCVYDNGAGTMWLPIGYESESAINFVKYTEVEQDDYQLVWLQVTDKDVWQEFSKHVNAESIAYSGTIDGTAVQDVDAALDALNAKKDVAVFSATLSGETLSSAATFPEISAAYSAGKQVLLKVLASGGAYWLLPLVRLLGGMVASFAAWVSNSRLAVATLNYSAASTPPVNAWSMTQVPLSAESVAYSGKVGSGTVANVKAALDGLAIGKPLDMTADYVASGTEYIEKWATMAKVVNGVASTTEYRVAQGQYVVREEENSRLYYVTIYPSALSGNDRMVSYIQIEGDFDFQFFVYNVGAPGETEKRLLNIGSDGSFIINNGKDAFPPATFVISLVRNADGTFTADEKLVSILPAYRRGDSIWCEYTDKLNDVGPVMMPVNRAHLVSTGFAPSEEDWIEFATTEIQYGDGDEELSFYRVEAAYENNKTTWKDYSTRKMPRLPEREASNAGKFLTADSRGVAKWASLPTYDGGVS